MPIEDRNLQAGTVLVGRHKGTSHRCEVVETPEGVRYHVDGSEIFRSLSSAAKHVTGSAVNGWVFWSVAGSDKAKREPRAKADPKQAPATKKPTKASKKRKAKKGKAMRAASKGEARYGCGACGETFPTMKAVTEHATVAHLS